MFQILKVFANDRHIRAKFQIYAANGTAITTYSERRLKLNRTLRSSEFEWSFIIADVQQPILGVDFLKHFSLLVDIRGRRLIDSKMQLQVIGTIITYHVPCLKDRLHQ